jgi:hypothetical protein
MLGGETWAVLAICYPGPAAEPLSGGQLDRWRRLGKRRLVVLTESLV